MNVFRVSRLVSARLCPVTSSQACAGRSLLSLANLPHGLVGVQHGIHTSALLHPLCSSSSPPVTRNPWLNFASTCRIHALSAAPRSPILQFVVSRILRATHRSRIPFARDRSAYGNRSSNPKGSLRGGFDSLPSGVIIWGILGINGMVFLAWYVATANYKQGDPSLLIKLHQNFVISAQNLQAGRIWTLVTSCFSHKEGMHMLFNSLAIYTISPLVVMALGNTGFLAFYVGSGVIANVFSYYWHRFARPDPNYSAHGASGSMSAVTAFLACMMPNATFLFFGIIPTPAWLLVSGLLAYDGYNTYNNVQNGVDAACHVGGLLTGMLYFVRRRFGV